VAVDLVAGGFGVVGAGHDGEELVVVVEDAEVVFVDFDGDGAPGVAHADVDALADDLDVATVVTTRLPPCRDVGRHSVVHRLGQQDLTLVVPP
jgi:hypothetical protein